MSLRRIWASQTLIIIYGVTPIVGMSVTDRLVESGRTSRIWEINRDIYSYLYPYEIFSWTASHYIGYR